MIEKGSDGESGFDDLDEGLDAGLEAAFGAPESRGASILNRIERLTGVKSQLLLHDAPGDESPMLSVHRLSNDDESAEDDSRYQVAGEIAKGGVGVVYKCRDRDLGRDVAVKVLRKAHAGNPEVFHRFVEEAQIGGQLQHPGIVPVYSLGLQPDGRPSFAMKLVKGRTLAAALKERKSPADDRRAWLRTFERICQTMAYAHARGVIHRDLKPSNVMIGAFGEVLVVDWGFGKVLGRAEPARPEPEPELTVVTTVRSESEGSASIAGSVMGTPAYMPPEQALGHVAELDEQTDVFALGAILTEILTGAPPYVGDRKDLLVMASQARLGDALARIENCDADPDLTALTKRCLEPLRGDRPANAGEVAEAISDLLTQAEARAHAAEVEAVKERSRVTQAKSHAAWERRAKRRTIGLAAAVLIAIAAAGGFYLAKDAKDRELAARARPQLERAVEEVSRLRGQGDWDEALAEANRAQHLAVDLDEEARREAAALVRETETAREAAAAEAAQVEKDKVLLAELEESQLRWLDLLEWRNPEVDAAISGAFQRYGLGIDEMYPEEAATRLRARGEDFAARVAAVFDEWSWIRRTGELAVGRGAEHLGRIASACDPDPTQIRTRELIRAADEDGLKALASDPDALDLPVRSLILLGRYLEEKERLPERIDLLERAVRRHPGDPWLHSHLGHALQAAGRYEGALRHLTVVLALRPQSGMAHSNVGAVLFNHFQEFQTSEKHFRAAIDLEASGAQFHCNLGNALAGQGRSEEAIEAYSTSIRLDPNEAKPYSGRGYEFLKGGRHEQAEQDFRKAIDRDPENARAWCGLGLAIKSHDAASALAAFEKSVEFDPKLPYALNHLGLALSGQNRREEARDAYERAIAADPNFAPAYTNLGSLLRREGKLDEAGEHHRKAIELDPSLVAPHFNLGQIRLGQGRLEEAVEVYRNLAEHHPSSPLGPYHEGYTLFTLGRKEEAEAALKEALRLDASLAWAHWSLGALLHWQGRFEEAIQAFRRGFECRPGPDTPRVIPRSFDPAERLRICERQAALAARLDDILAAGVPSAPHEDLEDLGWLCMLRERHAESAALYERALAELPELAENPDVLRAAANASVLASADEADPPRRSEYRSRALQWLHRSLDLWSQRVSPAALPQVGGVFLRDEGLASVRGEEAIALIPEAEREAWREFWERVDGLGEAASEED